MLSPKKQRYLEHAHPLVIRPARYVAATANGIYGVGVLTHHNTAEIQELLAWAAMWAKALARRSD